jgi:hypothetical protein
MTIPQDILKEAEAYANNCLNVTTTTWEWIVDAYAAGAMAERQKLHQAVSDAFEAGQVHGIDIAKSMEWCKEPTTPDKSEYISKLNYVPLKGNDPQDQAHPLRKT